MTEKIQHTINDIRLKSKSLHSQLVSERENKAALEVELNELKSTSNSLSNENSILMKEIEHLKSELNAILKKRVDEERTVVLNRNQDIDDLVREIEHCINQLKK
jgi:predicted  nucleic acid-binding Zn-ribbon protein